MITTVIGDLMQSTARVLVNPVNTVGVMGKGLAYDFKRCFPVMFSTYKDLCDSGDFTIGRLMLYRTPHKWVLNFPTKQHWRANSRLEDIETGLQHFVATYAEQGITSASFPRLGCGAGGLDWETEVRPLMETYLGPLPITIYIHNYDENDPLTPDDRSIRTLKNWLDGQPQPIGYGRFWRDLSRYVKANNIQHTLDGETRFSVGRDLRRRGRDLALVVSGVPQPLFISESQLLDLWTYIRSAGYALPTGFPGGLDTHADLIIAMLDGMDYLRPVHLLGDDNVPYVGLHYIPPTIRV
jgi:O-acetyl-ADP-ribose deacetylase (regulator of RNase III)